MTATRNYSHRVRAFIREIVRDNNNPMCVEKQEMLIINSIKSIVKKFYTSKFLMKVEEKDHCNGKIKKRIENREGWFVEKYDIVDKQAGAELCQAQVKLERAKVAVARKKLRAYL